MQQKNFFWNNLLKKKYIDSIPLVSGYQWITTQDNTNFQKQNIKYHKIEYCNSEIPTSIFVGKSNWNWSLFMVVTTETTLLSHRKLDNDGWSYVTATIFRCDLSKAAFMQCLLTVYLPSMMLLMKYVYFEAKHNASKLEQKDNFPKQRAPASVKYRKSFIN